MEFVEIDTCWWMAWDTDGARVRIMAWYDGWRWNTHGVCSLENAIAI
jgi:hypothetical protein